MGRQLLSEKAFLTLFIPLACALFFGAPAMVLQSYKGPVQRTLEATPTYVQGQMHKWWQKKAKSLHAMTSDGGSSDVEIPLVFLHERYPTDGMKTLRLHDAKYKRMAASMERSKSPSPLGYVYIFDTKDARELPMGELVHVTGVQWENDVCLLDTKRQRSFRIKSIRRDAKQGIMYAKVEWM
ncbi:hypothetical protein SPRG_13787 [Saprolegnia parasitica CBS 223.65]|uniref:Lon N-terminal domain-containing protein n=1 Tax=Saprolegnia parasitica (strain CBS 223.65) TaxID=695850 RepID=A0A067C3F0_SAPPC|nr:hypothetical protein SPRG_13787 [Saprolegnia parasitica CBS 223.65]KDO21081.1 hypothetical protein SPRG_13787 [Saprolegnia parasitica CBS 223.65]|eukprot:XP_012208178.1 hypothetical protein SPRG_13787 [Saprolegnia parasitica CBS 223.65]